MTIETSPRFEASLPFTLIEEGGNSNDAHDPGGRTHKGIIQREYDRFRRSKGLPLQSDYLMSDDEVKEIYWTEYWLPHCPGLPAGLDLSYFDNCVNEGPRRANILLQQALGISSDGIWGPQTQTAVDSIADVHEAVRRMTNFREQFYQDLGTFRYFGKGWMRRAEEIRTASLNMIGAADAQPNA